VVGETSKTTEINQQIGVIHLTTLEIKATVIKATVIKAMAIKAMAIKAMVIKAMVIKQDGEILSSRIIH
jgi:hypothetical protein